MSLILQIKRAAKDKGLYRGDIDDMNWEPSHVVMYNSFCNRFGGHFTSIPTRVNQTPEFLEFIDNYKDTEYTEGVTEQPRQIDGARLKDFVPDPLPVRKEGAANNEEIKQRQEMVNGNVVKVANKPPAPPEPTKVAENEAAKDNKENATDSGNTDANKEDTNKEASSDSVETKDASSDSSKTSLDSERKSETESSSRSAVSTDSKEGNVSSTGTPTPPIAAKTQTQSKPSSNAQGKSGTTVRVR